MKIIPFSFPGLPRVGCAFTTRQGGAGQGPFASANLSHDVGDRADSVAANRRELARTLGLSGLCELRQVHGEAIVAEPEPMEPGLGGIREGDGLFTVAPGQGLVIKTADCQPLLLAHAGGDCVMALHVGWRGNLADMPGKGVRRLCAQYGLDPADILAVRGPSLSPAASQFLNFEADFGPGFEAFFHPGTRTVDLWSLTRSQLMDAGVPARNIFGLDLCTRDNPDLFFSYRRERMTGRQAGVIWLKG